MQKYFFRLSIRRKLQLMIGFLFGLGFFLTSCLLFFVQRSQLISSANKLISENIEDLITLLELQHKEKTTQVATILRIASALLDSAKLQPTDSIITISAVHQITKEVTQVKVPVWKLGGHIPYEGGSHKLVDDAVALGGGSVTIFQKIPQGYLRISTTVRNSTGQRAVGTYIGNDSPVTQAINKGETFHGRAWVVDDWYQTIYQPIWLDGQIQGILYAGIREKDLSFLKEILKKRKYFLTGYAFLMDKSGNFIAHPFREGQNGSSEEYIQKILATREGEVAYKLDGITQKIYYSYFEPFEMYVAVSIPASEVYDESINRLLIVLLISFAVVIALSFVGTSLISQNIAGPIGALTDLITQLAKGKLVQPQRSARRDEIDKMTVALIHLVEGLSKYITFARLVGKGDFSYDFQKLSPDDELGQALLNMRNDLQAAAIENQQRSWVNDGLAQLNVLLRENTDLAFIVDKALAKLIQLVDANYGAFFLAEQDVNGQTVLNMKASYAYGRKKYLKNSFLPGEGLIGQVYLEKSKTIVKDINSNSVQIMFGFGEINPRFVIMLPVQLRDEILGVIEIGALKPLADYQIAFLERAIEAIAATITFLQINQRTTLLLQEAQMKAQQLAAQEEEIRQNFEELEATQEEMRRNEKYANETINRLKAEIEMLKSARQSA